MGSGSKCVYTVVVLRKCGGIFTTLALYTIS